MPIVPVALLALSLLAAPAAPAAPAPAPAPAGEETAKKDAQKAAEAWLALVDGGKYAESWTEAAKYFRGAVPQETWVTQVRGVRQPLGAVVSRKLKGATYTKSVPGAPDGEYVILQFDTSFANKKEAVETVTPMLDAGKWRVSGYFIR